ncbi:hypothetical protein Vretimale_9991 [Volvox reticuliferus]|uniref:Uncharacterized protein n=1 Tax=Volvox reticuliferus TaxID=1737510 RepID=A0A8J4GDP7_9CHLO|nr:hypothetical protein Vretimale_9991 [Volvox reticuliferus]
MGDRTLTVRRATEGAPSAAGGGTAATAAIATALGPPGLMPAALANLGVGVGVGLNPLVAVNPALTSTTRIVVLTDAVGVVSRRKAGWGEEAGDLETCEFFSGEMEGAARNRGDRAESATREAVWEFCGEEKGAARVCDRVDSRVKPARSRGARKKGKELREGRCRKSQLEVQTDALADFSAFFLPLSPLPTPQVSADEIVDDNEYEDILTVRQFKQCFHGIDSSSSWLADIHTYIPSIAPSPLQYGAVAAFFNLLPPPSRPTSPPHCS